MKYYVNWSLSHDNKDYSKGDTIEMSAKKAKHLLDSGVLSENNQESPNADEKTALIAKAISNLGENDFTEAGYPDLKAVEAIINEPVTQDELQAGWKKFTE